MKHTIVKRIKYEAGKTYYLKPFFDIHLGSTACDVAAFKRDLAATNENTYLFFGGDLFDSIVVTDPRYSKSNDATNSTGIINEVLYKMVDILKPYKDKIIGISSGNHESTLLKKCSFDIIEALCRELDVPNAGYSGLFKLIFTHKAGGRGRTVIVRYHHGWGGGSRTQGADLTKYSKDLTYWDADLYLYGHVHRKQTDEVPRLGLSGDKLISKPKVMCICGTYLKTYINGSTTYSEIMGYPPISIGGCCVSIKALDNWVKMKAYLD